MHKHSHPFRIYRGFLIGFAVITSLLFGPVGQARAVNPQVAQGASAQVVGSGGMSVHANLSSSGDAWEIQDSTGVVRGSNLNTGATGWNVTYTATSAYLGYLYTYVTVTAPQPAVIGTYTVVIGPNQSTYSNGAVFDVTAGARTPTGVTATPGNGQITISWGSVSGATGYSLYRGTTAGGEGATPIQTGLTGTSYTNTGLNNGATYFYTLASAGSAGTSGPSAEVSATPCITVTDPLTDWSIISSRSANWQFYTANTQNFQNDPSRAGRSTISTEYLIYSLPNISNFSALVYVFSDPASSATFSYSTDHGASFTAASTAAGALTASAGGWNYFTIGNTAPLPAGATDLKVQFAASGNAGEPQLSQITIKYNGMPLAPTGLTATAAGTQVALAWNAVSGATSYSVFRSTTAGGEGATPIATGIAATAYTDAGVSTGSTYYYKVAAVSGVGASAQSSEAAATVPLAAPTVLTAGGSSGQVKLIWNPSAGATSYSLYRGTAAGGEGATAIATGVTTTSFTNTGLSNGAAYFYKVAAMNATGASPQSNEASATPSTASTTVLDPLVDWTLTSGRSANWQFYTANTQYFLNDVSRAGRSVVDTEYLVYSFTNITSFNAMVYVWSDATSAATFYYSTNHGTSFTAIPRLSAR